MKFTSILVVALLVLNTGCKSTDSTGLNPERVDETRAIIASAIEDSQRRATMLAIVDSMESQITEIGAEVGELRQQIVEANREYDTTRADLELLYAELEKRVERITATLKEHSLDLRRNCTASEWAKIVDTKTETFGFSF
jgi:regulator of replication initiation timing